MLFPLKFSRWFEPFSARIGWFSQLATFLVWFGIVSVALWMHPNPYGHGTHEELGLPPCPSVLLFNRPCPGCGLTTSVSALVHGEIGFAFHAHPLGPILFAVFTAIAFLCLYGCFKGIRFRHDSLKFQRFLMGIIVVMMVVGAIRFAVDGNYRSPSERSWVIVSRSANDPALGTGPQR